MKLNVDCCIAGGGPAGIMLGLLLARAGLSVVMLEKHADFFRDFRGDTIHPSTLELLGELGLRTEFLRLPHTEISTLDAVINGTRLHPIDFSSLRAPDNFLTLMPQWDFLSFLAQHGRVYPGFHLRMQTTATELIRENGAVVGARANGPDGELEIHATLTVAADGRDSTLREASGLTATEFGVPIDVLWFRLPKPETPAPSTLAYLDSHSMVITIDRSDYFQVGLVIAKGDFEPMKQAGIAAFRAALATSVPPFATAVDSITDWNQVKLLSVQINRLERWHQPGFLCIGDAAHAMSPAFGVGVNYAIQDAVATANALVAPLRAGTVTTAELAAVHKRRMPPVTRMQNMQIRAHNAFARPGGGKILPNPVPLPTKMLLGAAMPVVRRMAARIVGRGFRPEHLAAELREPAAGA